MHLFGCKQTPKTPPTTTDEDSSGSTDDGEMKKQKGNRSMGKKKYPKAIRYYNKAVKIDPENATYRLNRAIAHAALDLWKDAEADAENAVRLGDPPSTKSHYQLARARFKRGNLDHAEEALDAGLEAYPLEPALVQLGREIKRQREVRALKLKRAQEAAIAQQSASSDQGADSDTKALIENARAAYTNNPEEALRLCVSARGISKQKTPDGSRDEINACSLQGKLLMKLRRWEESAEAYGRAVIIQEELYSADNAEEQESLTNMYNNLGIAQKNSGKNAEAVVSLKKAYANGTRLDDLMATPQVGQILQNLAQCLLQQCKPDEARGMYARALEVGQRLHGGEHASLGLNHLGIARCLTREGKIVDAIRAYTSAYELWNAKDVEECLREIPECPSKERFEQIQSQCQQELAQLVLQVEAAKRQVQEQQQPTQREGTENADPSQPAS